MPTVASIGFDLLMVGVVVAALFIGKKVGLLRMIFIGSIVFVAAFLARLLMPVVSAGLTQLKLGESVRTSVNDKIMGWIEEDADLDFEGVTEKLGLPKTIADKAAEKIEGIKNETGAALAAKISGFVADIAVRLSGFVIVALLIIVILVVISLLTRLIEKIPVLGDINAIGGLLVGIITGLVIVFIVCMLVCGAGIGGDGGIFSEITEKSFLIRGLDALGIVGRMIK